MEMLTTKVEYNKPFCELTRNDTLAWDGHADGIVGKAFVFTEILGTSDEANGTGWSLVHNICIVGSIIKHPLEIHHRRVGFHFTDE